MYNLLRSRCERNVAAAALKGTTFGSVALYAEYHTKTRRDDALKLELLKELTARAFTLATARKLGWERISHYSDENISSTSRRPRQEREHSAVSSFISRAVAIFYLFPVTCARVYIDLSPLKSAQRV